MPVTVEIGGRGAVDVGGSSADRGAAGHHAGAAIDGRRRPASGLRGWTVEARAKAGSGERAEGREAVERAEEREAGEWAGEREVVAE